MTESLFEKEKDLSNHVKDVGVLLLDLSDSVKDKLSQNDQEAVKETLITLRMNCDAMLEDVSSALKIAKKNAKTQLADVKKSLDRLRANADAFLPGKDRELIFQEMNKDYANVLGTLTMLMAG
jgi:light-regulated signal transduction histidine kinase (bacteriophytochrome)